MSRKKTRKKNEYTSFPNCFDNEAKWKGKWNEYFKNEEKLVLELGCGRAELGYGLAKMYPKQNYVGIDLKPARMWAAARVAIAEKINNIAFLHIDLRSITDHFEENEVDELWITFPDPFPKKRQAKHRMINPPFLELYKKILKPGGIVHYKTDNRPLFLYSMEVFVKEGNVDFHSLTFNLHESEILNEENGIKTTYEKRFMDLGEQINYVSFSFRGI